jgi:hypothetical protein
MSLATSIVREISYGVKMDVFANQGFSKVEGEEALTWVIDY